MGEIIHNDHAKTSTQYTCNILWRVAQHSNTNALEKCKHKKNYKLNMSPASHVFFLPSLTMKSHNTALFFHTKSFVALEARDTTNIIPSKFTCHTVLDAVHLVYVLVIALHVA